MQLSLSLQLLHSEFANLRRSRPKMESCRCRACDVVDGGDAVSAVPRGKEERAVWPISTHTGRLRHARWHTGAHH